METQQLLENVQRLLREQHIAVVGTIESNGQPHGATIFCVMHEDGTIFFPTRTSSRKYKNSQTNPLISLVVTHPTEPITVQMHGTIAETTDPAMTQHAIEHLMTCTSNTSPMCSSSGVIGSAVAVVPFTGLGGVAVSREDSWPSV
jgi:general stress protein 26